VFQIVTSLLEFKPTTQALEVAGVELYLLNPIAQIDVEVNGEGREIFKDPITDDGTKKSATGLLCVATHKDGHLVLADKVTWDGEANGVLQTIYKDSEFFNTTTLTDIKNRLK
jgi:hypothetical protein